jgi:hypothetical protein
MKFDAANDANPEKDFEMYCNKLNGKAKYVIEEKKKEADGSLVVKIKKQYNNYKTSGYIE